MWGLRKIPSAHEKGGKPESCSSVSSLHKAGAIESEQHLSDSHSLEGLPHSDGDSSDDDESEMS